MKIKKIIITVLVLVAVALLGIKGKSILQKRKNEVAEASVPQVEKITVPVVYAKEGSLRKHQSFLATLLADKSIKLSTKLTGFVEKVYVSESQHVKKGEVLVRIDATEVRSGIEALRSTLSAQKNDLAVAKTIFNRNKKLYDMGGVAKEKLDLSRAALGAKAAMVENTIQKIAQLRHQLSYLKIVAPFDGVVDTLLLHEGDLAAAGKPILALSSDEKKLVFSFAPSQKSTITKGQKVFVDNVSVGYVKTLYNVSINALATAEVSLEKEIALPIGSNLNIEVLTSLVQGCVVPSDTLLHKKEGVFVMVYEHESFKSQKVSVKMQEGEKAVILPCPANPVAQASEVKLAALGAYEKVEITGEKHE